MLVVVMQTSTKPKTRRCISLMLLAISHQFSAFLATSHRDDRSLLQQYVSKSYYHRSLLLHNFVFPRFFPNPYFFFFNDTATTEIYTLSLHDALPFFFKEHTPHLHSHTYLACRLLL